MRFLLLSDTHGKLGVINDLAAEVGADAVIHAGDFGFYDEGSYERLSERELRLHIAHSALDAARKTEILGLSHEERIEVCLEARGSETAKVEQAFSVIDKIPETEARLGRGVKVPLWYRKMTHINLPDADVGYAVMDLTDKGAEIRTSPRSLGNE